MTKSYLTISDALTHEIEPIKGSRFIGYGFPIDSHEDAIELLSQVRQKHPNANHHCWAYQLRDGITMRSSDDGEPAGSAGKPILAPLVGKAIFDVLVIVVRYFGGVKLGVGGLVRAYSQCANATVDSSNVIEIIATIKLGVQFDYEETNAVNALISSNDLAIASADYGNKVTLWFDIEQHQIDMIKEKFISFTADKIVFIKNS